MSGPSPKSNFSWAQLFGRGAPSETARPTYGFNADDPIMCDQPLGELQYINSLRCPGGHRLRGSRLGSMGGKCRDPKTHRSPFAGTSLEENPAEQCVVDRYDLRCDGGEYSCTLYFDMYHPDVAHQPAPVGLSRAG